MVGIVKLLLLCICDWVFSCSGSLRSQDYWVGYLPLFVGKDLYFLKYLYGFVVC